jgi:hypothetical protein
MAFTGTAGDDTANATTGTLIGFTGGNVSVLVIAPANIINGLAGNDTIVAGLGN